MIFLLFLAFITPSISSIINKKPIITILQDDFVFIKSLKNASINVVETPAPNLTISNYTNNSIIAVDSPSELLPEYATILITLGSLCFVTFGALGAISIKSKLKQKRLIKEEAIKESEKEKEKEKEKENENKKSMEEVNNSKEGSEDDEIMVFELKV